MRRQELTKSPPSMCSESLLQKALRHDQKDLIIAADTTVALNGEIFGQPQDIKHAGQMIQKLSGNTHSVLTAVSVRWDGLSANGFDESKVTMREVTSELLEWYLATGESMGKAGAYAVQGQGAALTADVRGELDTVIGLPVRLLETLLGRIGLDLREISGSGK
ncbi:MAG: hypothetical protein RLZZ105_593 [Actinomycetota bacterium]